MQKVIATVVSCVVFLAVVVEANAQPIDQTGFVSLLNQARAARGLGPVAFDPQAAIVAAQNDAAQLAYGLGHWQLGGYGQVAAVGIGSAQAALDAWTGSPSHAGILFAPDLITVGFDLTGSAATASTSQGGYGVSQAQTYGYATLPSGWHWVAPGYDYQWNYPQYRRRGWRKW